MGHETPEHASPDVASARRPDLVDARPQSGPSAAEGPLADRAAVEGTLRPGSIQRLQGRAGNAAVASMLQRRAAPATRKPNPSLQRRGATTTTVGGTGRAVGVQRSATNDVGQEGSAPTAATEQPLAAGGAADAVAFAGGSEAPGGSATGIGGPSAPDSPASQALSSSSPSVVAPTSIPAPPSLQRRPRNDGDNTSARAIPSPSSLQRRPLNGAAATTAVPTNGDALPVQRSLASLIEQARKMAAPPSGPEDTKSVEGDTDMSDFTDAPQKANQERAAIPPPPQPPKPKIPEALTATVGDKPPLKPPAKKVGKPHVAGPKPKARRGAGTATGAAAPGEIVKKPAPPLPPVWKKPPPGKPIGELPAAAVDVPKTRPKEDPAFNKVLKAAGITVKKARKHPKGIDESKSAQGAAVPPGNDIESQAKAHRADTMATAKPKPFDEEMFVTAVKQELAKTAPKNLSEAGDVGKKADGAKHAIKEKAGVAKDKAAGDVEQKSEEPPNPGDATPKTVTPMAPLEIEKPEGMKASGAMPAPVPNEAIDMREGPAKVDNEMGEAGVTEEQLAKSNEPEFTGALDAKKEGEKHSAEAPAEIRKAEGAVLKQAGQAAAAVEKKSVGESQSTISQAVGNIVGKKGETKSKDELKRKEVSDHINSIFDKTKQDVDGILKGLDEKVDNAFTIGEQQIRAEFTADWSKRLEAYKDDRYSGLRGKYRWVRDKFKGLPAKANQLFEISRRLYEDSMDKLVRRIATIVTQELTRATVRIEQGRGEVAAYVSTLKGDLAKFGQEAADDISEKFGNLDSAVKDKFDDMASSLAKKYAESREAVDAEIEKAKEANKGLIDKAIGAVKAVIRVIKQLKEMVLTILAKIADVIGRIIADPIGFLKNFLKAVGDGISRFASRIGEHLQKGLMGWLFGALGAAGIEIPESFSLEGILKLVMSVLGFTWDFIKQRLVKKIGEPAVNALMQGADLVKKVVTGGPAVLWEMIVEKFSDFEDMVVGEIKNFVIEKVVKAGISWLLGLLTPAGAFIKACQAIYSIVMFFVERGSEIKEFVESIIDAAGDIARGGGGGVAEKIEGVLAKLLPLAISFLANLLGLGGIGEKVRSIIEKVQKPIGKAIDKVLDVVLKITGPIWKPIKAMYAKGKALYGKAKDKALAAYEAGKAKVKQVGAKVKDVAMAGVTKAKQIGSWGVDKAKVAGQKAKDIGSAAKDKVLGLLKPQTKATTMSGASHSLIAEPTKNGKFKIFMKSEKELLSSKLGRTIKKLEERAAGEAEPMKGKTQAQIAQLREIAEISHILESVNADGKKVTAMGAPEGFETEMRLLSEKVKGFGDKNGVKDITASDAGTQVDMRLLARFGMPIPNYLQAQEVADQFGAMIDIRATAVGAPELLAQGFTPKSEKFKQKTMNKDDELLGLPPELRDRVVWFLPSRPKPENFKDYPEDVLRRVWARWRQRKDEYYDNLAKMKKKLRDGQVAVRPVTNASAGGVVEESTKGIDSLIKSVGITGDHDVYQVHGNAAGVIAALTKAPFRVQHGAHLDWPSAVREAEKRSLTPTEQRIFQAIVAKHLKGGESLLRINPHGPPTTANSSAQHFALSGSEPPTGSGGEDDLEVVDAKEPGGAGPAGPPQAAPGGAPAAPEQSKFTAAGTQHTVTLKSAANGEPEVIISSTPMTPAVAVQHTTAAGQLALLDINELSRSTNDILSKSKRLKEMARQASVRAGRYPPEVAAALADLSHVVAACWDSIGFDGENIDRVKVKKGEAGKLSDVGAHKGGQGLRTDKSQPATMQELTALESEHVLPWSWIDAIFSQLYRVGSLPSQGESRVYPKMTTVMTYAGAATGKTSRAIQNSDMEVLRWLRSVSPREARITLRDNLPKMIEHRMQIILNETAAYVARVKRDYGIDLPQRPDGPVIAKALAAQLAEVFSAARELR